MALQERKTQNVVYLGVTWNKNNRKWQAQYQIGKKKIYIGCFGTQEEAHEAYVNAIKEI